MEVLNNDKPLESTNEDKLDRTRYAKSIAEILISYKDKTLDEGLVFGLYGEWGSGKTSFINFIKEYLKKSFSNKDTKKNSSWNLTNYLKWLVSLLFLILILYFNLSYFLLNFDIVRFFCESYYFSWINPYILLSAFCFIVKLIVTCYLIIKMPLDISWFFELIIMTKNKFLYLKNSNKKSTPEDMLIIDFAPWNILDEKSIIKEFFNIIRKNLQKEEKPEVLSALDEYVAKLLTYFSPGIFQFDFNKNDDILNLKEDLRNVLKKLKQKTIIFIDDIDRLSDKEIYFIFKLIKAIANLPNIIYFLSFDKKIIANALNNYHKDYGEQFIEKIIQIPFEMPQLNSSLFQKYIFSELELFLTHNEISNNKWNTDYAQYWSHPFASSICNFFNNIRDFKRFINIVTLSYPPSLHNEVNIVDLWVINAIKIAYPNLYDFIKNNKNLLTHSTDIEINNLNNQDEIKIYKEKLEKIIEEDINLSFRSDIYSILNTMFPILYIINKKGYSPSSYTSEKTYSTARICIKEHFDKYFIYDTSDKYTNKMILENIKLADNYNLFVKKLEEIDEKSELKIFLNKFEYFIDQSIPENEVTNIIKALFECGDYFKPYDEDFLAPDIFRCILHICYKFAEIYQNDFNRILKKAFNVNKSINPAVDFIYKFLNNNFNLSYIEEDLIEELKNETLSEIEERANADINSVEDKSKSYNGSLIANKNVARILYFWKEYGNKDYLSQYIATMTNTDKKLVYFIDKLKNPVYSSQNKWKKHYEINKSTLEAFLKILINKIYHKKIWKI